jgi:hypothetical protein
MRVAECLVSLIIADDRDTFRGYSDLTLSDSMNVFQGVTSIYYGNDEGYGRMFSEYRPEILNPMQLLFALTYDDKDKFEAWQGLFKEKGYSPTAINLRAVLRCWNNPASMDGARSCLTYIIEANECVARFLGSEITTISFCDVDEVGGWLNKQDQSESLPQVSCKMTSLQASHCLLEMNAQTSDNLGYNEHLSVAETGAALVAGGLFSCSQTETTHNEDDMDVGQQRSPVAN